MNTYKLQFYLDEEAEEWEGATPEEAAHEFLQSYLETEGYRYVEHGHTNPPYQVYCDGELYSFSVETAYSVGIWKAKG